jgi:hypothetical protein
VYEITATSPSPVKEAEKQEWTTNSALGQSPPHVIIIKKIYLGGTMFTDKKKQVTAASSDIFVFYIADTVQQPIDSSISVVRVFYLLSGRHEESSLFYIING